MPSLPVAAIPRAEYDDDGNLIIAGKPNAGKIMPLPPIDHSTIVYPSVKKQFYVEHPDTRAWSDADVAQFRKDEAIIASGHDVVKPIQSFMHAGMELATWACLVRLVRTNLCLSLGLCPPRCLCLPLCLPLCLCLCLSLSVS